MSKSSRTQSRQFVVWCIYTVVFLRISDSNFYGFSTCTYFANAANDCYNQSFFALLNVVFTSFYWCTNTILNAVESFSSFFSWHLQFISFLRCKAYCIVINFLIFWSICQSSFINHLKNCLEYLTRENTQLFISLMKYLLKCLVSRSFLVLLRCTFPFISACLMVSVSNVPKYL